MRETDVEVIRSLLRICNSIPCSLGAWLPQGLSLPLVRGDGVSRLKASSCPHPTPGGRLDVCPLLAVGKFCLRPSSCLLLYHRPMFSCFVGHDDQPEMLGIREDEPGSPLRPTCPLPFRSPGSTATPMALPGPSGPLGACRTLWRDRLRGVRPGLSS